MDYSLEVFYTVCEFHVGTAVLGVLISLVFAKLRMRLTTLGQIDPPRHRQMDCRKAA